MRSKRYKRSGSIGNQKLKVFKLLRRKIYSWFAKPVISWYLRKERPYTYKNLVLRVPPGVFHPGFFFSSEFMARFIDRLDLRGRKLLEVGAGSGLLSLIAFSKGADVTCLEINASAIPALRSNFEKNFSGRPGFKIYQSDLFEKIPVQEFDVIVVNPPYFFKDPENDSSYAWYCGRSGRFFSDFFKHARPYLQEKGEILMCLAENCDIRRIQEIAMSAGYQGSCIHSEKVKWEMNFLYRFLQVEGPG
jgi:release factor glutamine methyltransferase